MSEYVNGVIDAALLSLAERDKRIADLAAQVTMLYEAAKDYADCVGHGKDCEYAPCDCGYRTLRDLLDGMDR